MLINSTITIILAAAILLLVTSLVFFILTKHLRKVSKRKIAEEYRGKGALLPIANIYAKPRISAPQHPALNFEHDSFRKSFYHTPCSPTPSAFTIPEIRITFPEEDAPLQTRSGERTGRVVVVQVGESGAAYVTAPPPYESEKS